jgi:hypothetical protein
MSFKDGVWIIVGLLAIIVLVLYLFGRLHG